MSNVYEKYVGLGYEYNWDAGPAQVLSRPGLAESIGANCMTIVHMAVQGEFGISLPTGMHLHELYRDIAGRNGKFFRPVSREMRLWRPGDAVVVGLARPDAALDRFTEQYDERDHLKNWLGSPLRHAGLYTGEWDEATDQPRILHTSQETGLQIATLSEIMNMEPGTHAKLYEVGRLIDAP